MIDLPLQGHYINYGDSDDDNDGDNDDVVKKMKMMYNVHTTSMRIIPTTVATLAPAAI